MDKLFNEKPDFMKELLSYSLGILLTILIILPFIN